MTHCQHPAGQAGRALRTSSVDPRCRGSKRFNRGGRDVVLRVRGDMIDGLVPGKQSENGPRRRLSALYQWLTGAPSASNAAPSFERTSPRDAAMPDRIGHYAITRKLGAGAMGVVYAARDERLERIVALENDVVGRTRRHRAQAVLARGAGRRERQSSERLPDLRDRRGRAASCSSRWSCSRAKRWPIACARER